MTTKASETMGVRLQRLRKAAGLTQAELAERAGVPLRSLLNWEQDRRQPRLDAALGLARVLSVQVEELVKGVAPRDERPPAKRGRPSREVGAEMAAKPVPLQKQRKRVADQEGGDQATETKSGRSARRKGH